MVAGIPVHAGEAVDNSLFRTLDERQNGVNERLPVVLETFVVQTDQMVLSSSDFMSHFSDAVTDSPLTITPVAALVNSKQQTLVS